MAQGPLVKIDGVTKRFVARRNALMKPLSFVHAVDGINLDIMAGETLAIVGESGSGKTTLARLLTKLEDVDSGAIRLASDELAGQVAGQGTLADLSGGWLRAYRRSIGFIFQDPYEAMNPRRTILDTVIEPLAIHGVGDRFERVKQGMEMLSSVGLDAPELARRLPHELSGGQRQRVAIARALVLHPRLVIADEPTSMLDVSVQAGVLNLLAELQRRRNLTYVYITHDFAVARHIATRIAVLYLGKIVEVAEADELVGNPRHPYTRALLAAVPEPGIPLEAPSIGTAIASAVDPPARCRFFNRCPLANEVCAGNDHPPLDAVGQEGHTVACYRSRELG